MAAQQHEGIPADGNNYDDDPLSGMLREIMEGVAFEGAAGSEPNAGDDMSVRHREDEPLGGEGEPVPESIGAHSMGHDMLQQVPLHCLQPEQPEPVTRFVSLCASGARASLQDAECKAADPATKQLVDRMVSLVSHDRLVQFVKWTSASKRLARPITLRQAESESHTGCVWCTHQGLYDCKQLLSRTQVLW